VLNTLVDQTGAAASVLYQHNTITPQQQQQYPKSEFNAVLVYGIPLKHNVALVHK